MGQHASLDRFTSGCDQVGGESHALHSRSAGADVTEHEPEHRQAREVDVEAVTPVGDVVTKPGRDLGCIRDAADPSEGGHVVQRTALAPLETHVVAETRGDKPRSQDVLHRLAQPQVHGQRERSDQLRQSKA